MLLLQTSKISSLLHLFQHLETLEGLSMFRYRKKESSTQEYLSVLWPLQVKSSSCLPNRLKTICLLSVQYRCTPSNEKERQTTWCRWWSQLLLWTIFVYECHKTGYHLNSVSFFSYRSSLLLAPLHSPNLSLSWNLPSGILSFCLKGGLFLPNQLSQPDLSTESFPALIRDMIGLLFMIQVRFLCRSKAGREEDTWWAILLSFGRSKEQPSCLSCHGIYLWKNVFWSWWGIRGTFSLLHWTLVLFFIKTHLSSLLFFLSLFPP